MPNRGGKARVPVAKKPASQTRRFAVCPRLRKTIGNQRKALPSVVRKKPAGCSLSVSRAQDSQRSGARQASKGACKSKPAASTRKCKRGAPKSRHYLTGVRTKSIKETKGKIVAGPSLPRAHNDGLLRKKSKSIAPSKSTESQSIDSKDATKVRGRRAQTALVVSFLDGGGQFEVPLKRDSTSLDDVKDAVRRRRRRDHPCAELCDVTLVSLEPGTSEPLGSLEPALAAASPRFQVTAVLVVASTRVLKLLDSSRICSRAVLARGLERMQEISATEAVTLRRLIGCPRPDWLRHWGWLCYFQLCKAFGRCCPEVTDEADMLLGMARKANTDDDWRKVAGWLMAVQEIFERSGVLEIARSCLDELETSEDSKMLSIPGPEGDDDRPVREWRRCLEERRHEVEALVVNAIRLVLERCASRILAEDAGDEMPALDRVLVESFVQGGA